ncbi:hypothetical protein SVIO_105180 [Streptomyces violaceusniger]|uniref:Uncharacterized protein n=1 Tax=Streptomyces violaceusniger TaxID=68280 RepID=A0A4D4LFY2_STRVO|nr:hypothetical protein SVIO_105180 [Streptomyces violaceusniger]
MVIRCARALTEMVVADPGLGRAAGGTRVIRAGAGARALGARGRRGLMGDRTGSGARGTGGNQRQQDGEERDERSREPVEPVTGGRDGAGYWAHAPSLSCWVIDFPASARRGVPVRGAGPGLRPGSGRPEPRTPVRGGAGVRVR